MNPFARFLLCALLLASGTVNAQSFRLPTPNRSIFKLSEQEKYFTGTVGRPWTSGTFGCVRSGGAQLHEGIDVRCVQRDKDGEPIDPVFATADGQVAYINAKASLSNYGIYVVLQHRIDGLEIYSSYAHLREVRKGLKAGQEVKAGETIGTLGRTTNTREQISKERAHVHFEINFFVNDRFDAWYKKSNPGVRNDHGIWNGQNLIGIDPQIILLQAQRLGAEFNLRTWVQQQPEFCRVVVRDTTFPWLTRYRSLVRPNPIAAKQGIAGYEIALNFNGLPISLTPRAASELKSAARYHVLSVNAGEYRLRSCRGLVTQKGRSWELGNNGVRLLDLLTY